MTDATTPDLDTLSSVLENEKKRGGWRAAFATLQTLADETGAAAAQNLVGRCLALGKGTRKDLPAAARYLRLAADQGLVGSQFELALALQDGKGIERSEAEAVRYFRLAADQGSSDAQNSLGVCFLNGTGVAQDKTEAARYFRLAADQGSAEAKQNLVVALAPAAPAAPTAPAAPAAPVRLAAASLLRLAAFVVMGVNCYEMWGNWNLTLRQFGLILGAAALEGASRALAERRPPG